ncbi:MAG: phytanoyl-CoA dioxygenase family protein [Myxococcota bacterium]
MLPALDDAYRLPDDVIRSFRRDGHVRVGGLASPAEVAAYRPAIVETGPRGLFDDRPLTERDTYGQAFLQMFNLWTLDERVRAFVFSRRFAQVAAELMGVDGVRLYHDQALFKEPGGGFTPWHQDQFYWPLDTEHTITLWMPLVEITPAMGPMAFASGSQRLGKLCDLPISDASEAAYRRAVEEHGLACTDPETFAPGDATFHAGWTMHRAPANRTDRMREVMTAIYYADGTKVGPLDHPNRRFDRDVWLRGCEEGELAAGPKNPVLWRSDA